MYKKVAAFLLVFVLMMGLAVPFTVSAQVYLPDIEITELSVLNGRVTIEWKLGQGGEAPDGFWIEYSPEMMGMFDVIATVNNRNARSFTTQAYQAGRIHYFNVIAFKRVGTRVYESFASPVGILIPAGSGPGSPSATPRPGGQTSTESNIMITESGSVDINITPGAGGTAPGTGTSGNNTPGTGTTAGVNTGTITQISGGRRVGNLPPVEITAITEQHGSVTLEWQLGTGGRETPSEFWIYYTTEPGGRTVILEGPMKNNPRRYTATSRDFEAGVTYYFTVAAYSEAGSEYRSNLASITMPAAAATTPTTPRLEPGNYKSGDFEFYVHPDGTLSITGYTGRGGAIVIPAELMGHPVTRVGYNSYGAFIENNTITNVVISEGITSIGPNAFLSAHALRSVTIPDSLTLIDDCAFSDCIALTTVNFGKDSRLERIGRSAFDGCTALTSITLPDNLKGIGWLAFYQSGIWNNAPNGFLYIGNWLTNHKGTVPRNTNLAVRNGTVGIGDSMLYTLGSGSLVSVTLPNSLRYIGMGAFGLSGLRTVTIPNSVLEIGNGAFGGSSSLTQVNIGTGVTRIGDYAFQGCAALNNLTIPANVKYVGKDILLETAWMNRQANGPVYTSNWLVGYKGNMPRNTDITVRNGTVGIAAAAFFEQTNLRSITIPNSVTSGIATHTFYMCRSLERVVLGNGIPYIGNWAFVDVRALTDVTFGTGLKHIGDWAFVNAPLSALNLPDGLLTIGERAIPTQSTFDYVIIPDSVTHMGTGALHNVTIYANLGTEGHAYSMRTGTIRFIPLDMMATDVIPPRQRIRLEFTPSNP